MKHVTAAILINDGFIFIAKRRANDRLGGKWEFPGGTIEDNETPEECLKREIMEEFDIDVSVGDFFSENVHPYDHVRIKLSAYQIYWDNGSITLNDHAEFKWVSPDNLLDYDLAPADIPIAREVIRNFSTLEGCQ